MFMHLCVRMCFVSPVCMHLCGTACACKDTSSLCRHVCLHVLSGKPVCANTATKSTNCGCLPSGEQLPTNHLTCSHTALLVAVSVNDPPVISNQSYTIDEDQALVVIAANGLLRGSSDVDGNVIVVVNTTMPANGNLTVQPNGAFTYMPNLNFNGKDGFEFTATDGQGAFVKGVANITIGESRGRLCR